MDTNTQLLQQAQRLIAAGQRVEAIPLLSQLADNADCPLAIVLQLAEIEIGHQRAAMAQSRLQNWLQYRGASNEVDFMLAKAELALGQINNAKQRLLALHQRLPAHTPSVALALLLATIEEKIAAPAAAIRWLREAIQLEPQTAQHHQRLGYLFYRIEHFDEAKAALENAIRLDHKMVAAWELLGEINARQNATFAAIDCYKHYLDIKTDQSAIWKRLAHLQLEMWFFADAIATLSRATQFVESDIDFDVMLGHAKQELGDSDGALQDYQHAIKNYPINLPVLIGERLLLKQVYETGTDVQHWRERYTHGLGSLLQHAGELDPVAQQVFALERSNFLLAYQGENDRELQRQYASLLAGFADKAAPQWRQAKEKNYNGGRKLRAGFFGSLFRICTAGLYFEKWITALDPDRFEIVVYHTAPLTDELSKRVAAASSEFVPLRVNAKSAAKRIAADNLDVLVYPEVGMDAMTCLLSTLRLAPVQCAGWGHPVTTGSDNIDYFITCDLMEPANAATHYTEQLIRLPGIGVDYAMPAVEPGATRAQFGLPDDAILYFCPQSLFKIHPEMDALFADIIERDERANVILFQGASLHVTNMLGTRIQQHLNQRGIAPRKQLKFLPRMGTAQFRQALSLADVVLDTVRWSGGNTSLDAFACGVPVVTWPGELMRGRQTMAMLNIMGLQTLIASSAGEYVQLAIEVANNPQRNAGLRDVITRQRAQLFNQQAPIQALAENLIKIAALPGI